MQATYYRDEVAASRIRLVTGLRRKGKMGERGQGRRRRTPVPGNGGFLQRVGRNITP